MPTQPYQAEMTSAERLFTDRSESTYTTSVLLMENDAREYIREGYCATRANIAMVLCGRNSREKERPMIQGSFATLLGRWIIPAKCGKPQIRRLQTDRSMFHGLLHNQAAQPFDLQLLFL
jgi:hypothetical protein